MVSSVPFILILSGVQSDPRRYRTFHLFEQAQMAGLNCQLSHITDPSLRQKAAQSSVIILHRAAYDEQVAWLEKNIHERGGVLIGDVDDLVFDPEAVQYIHSPDFSDPVRRALYLEEVGRFRHTIELCDQVMVSSDYLAERIKQMGKPATVHRNAYSLEMLALAEQASQTTMKATDKIVIGYASGTPTHDIDFGLIKPVLKSTLIDHPEVELWLAGSVDPGSGWGETAGRVRKTPRVPWRKLAEIQAHFDINLAPLEVNNPFGQSKSEIKYVEAALLRVPTIASPSDSYSFAIRDGENGKLAGEPGEWHNSLEALINQPELRKQMGETAYYDVLKQYHPQVRAKQLIETLNQTGDYHFEVSVKLTSAEAEKPGQFWSCAEYENSPSTIQRGIYSLRYRDLRTLFRQVWIYFRRLVSPIFPFPNPR